MIILTSCLISIVIYKFILINDQSEDFILAFALRFDFTFSDYYLTFLLKCIRFWPTMKDLFSESECMNASYYKPKQSTD